MLEAARLQIADLPPEPTRARSMKAKLLARPLPPLMVRRERAAKLCSVSLATWDRRTA